MGAAKREYVPVEARVAVEGMKETPSAVEHGGYVAKNFFMGVMLVGAARTDFFVVRHCTCRITKRTMLATFKGKSKL